MFGTPKANRHLVAGIFVIAGLIVVDAAVSYRNIQALSDNDRLLAHSHEVTQQISAVLTDLDDAETGDRGFILTGQDMFLEPYASATMTLPGRLNALQSLTMDNPAQQQRMTQLRSLVAAKMDNAAAGIRLRRNEGFDAARAFVATGDGKRTMDAVRTLAKVMLVQESGLLAQRRERARQAYDFAFSNDVLLALVALLTLLTFVWFLRRSMRRTARMTSEIDAQREVLRATLVSIGDGVIATDTRGRITFLNPVAEELTGWTARDASGQPLERVFAIVNEQTRECVDNPAVLALREDRTVGLASHAVMIAKDGRETPIEDSAAPIRSASGALTGVVLVFRSVKEKRAAEQALRESEQRQRLMLASIPQKVFTSDLNGQLDYFNPEWATYCGLESTLLGNSGWKRCVHADDLDESERLWMEALRTGAPFEVERRLRRTNDTYRWHLSRAMPLRSEHGEIIMWVGSDTDIHEQKENAEDLRRIAAELSEADNRKVEFLATLAHELRNPLAPIRSGLSVLRMARGDEKQSTEALTVIERQFGHLVRLVDDLMDASRINRGSIELRKEPILIADVVNSAVETSRPLIEQMGHRLVVSVPPEPMTLVADATRLAQVFSNLLNNAAKYIEHGGTIWIDVQRDASDVTVTVRDTGIGIPAQRLESIFEMFVQVDTSVEKSHGGLGIGLSLVRRLVVMHGGAVSAKSEGSGKGSTVLVRLPLAGTASVRPVATQASDSKEPLGLRILVVDDNKDSADSSALMLRMLGNDTRTAYDGLEGVDALKDYRPDAVLMDLGLPRLNGYEACRLMRAMPEGRSIVIVAVTGWSQADDRKRSDEVGFDHYIIKPIEMGSLLEILRSVAPRHAAYPDGSGSLMFNATP